MVEQVTPRILAVIDASAALQVSAASLRHDDDLYRVGLKSLAAVRLMVALEEEFGIAFPDSVLNHGAFATIDQIRRNVCELLPGDATPAQVGQDVAR
jgi:acyl carrier protein